MNMDNVKMVRKVCKIVPAMLNENIGDISALVVATGEY